MLQIPVSVGELIDKITILEIKLEKIKDEEKLINIRRELYELHSLEPPIEEKSKLKEINHALWVTEDRLRELEKDLSFGDEFIKLARSVYKLNDERALVKKNINTFTNSHIVEEKSYSHL